MKRFARFINMMAMALCIAVCFVACKTQTPTEQDNTQTNVPTDNTGNNGSDVSGDNTRDNAGDNTGDNGGTVEKQVPTYVVPDNLSVAYGLTLGDLPLPVGFSWQDDLSTPVGEVGQNTFRVTYTPTDTRAYQTVQDIDVVVTVTKADPTYSIPTELTAIYGQTLSEISLPTGFAWQNAALSVGNAGTNQFAATYTPADTLHYDVVGNVTLTVAVAKAQIEVAGVAFEDLTVTYDGQAHTIVATNVPEGVVVNARVVADAINAGTYYRIIKLTPADTLNYKDVVVAIEIQSAKADIDIPTTFRVPMHRDLSLSSVIYGNGSNYPTLPEGWTLTSSNQSFNTGEFG